MAQTSTLFELTEVVLETDIVFRDSEVLNMQSENLFDGITVHRRKSVVREKHLTVEFDYSHPFGTLLHGRGQQFETVLYRFGGGDVVQVFHATAGVLTRLNRVAPEFYPPFGAT